MTKDDGQLKLGDPQGSELGFLHRAAQMRVYIQKEGGSGPVSRVHLPNHSLDDVTISVKADSHGHRQCMEEDGTQYARQCVAFVDS